MKNALAVLIHHNMVIVGTPPAEEKAMVAKGIIYYHVGPRTGAQHVVLLTLVGAADEGGGTRCTGVLESCLMACNVVACLTYR
jgi:hypothetical protein